MSNTIKTIKELNLMDSFLFAKVMADTETCRRVLERILGASIRGISMPASQRTADAHYNGNVIRRDISLNDDRSTVCHVEMECMNQTEAFLPKKARYYEEDMDLDASSAGNGCGELNKSFVIFICNFDPFGERRHIYTFENRCAENPSLVLGDDCTKIFLNTKGNMHDVDPEMLEFLSYAENTTDGFAEQARSPLIKEIHKKVTEIKESKDMEAEYIALLQMERDALHEALAQAYKGKTFSVFGLTLPPIRELLPAVPVGDGFIDSLFLLEDGTYAVVEYASGYHKADIARYPEHIAEILKRYDKEDGSFDLRLVIIYAGDVEEAEPSFDFGCLTIRPEQAFLSRMNGEAESDDIWQKIHSNRLLTDDDLMKLVVLPLAVPGSDEKAQSFDRILALAGEIPDEAQRNFVLSAMALTTKKFIDRE